MLELPLGPDPPRRVAVVAVVCQVQVAVGTGAEPAAVATKALAGAEDNYTMTAILRVPAGTGALAVSVRAAAALVVVISQVYLRSVAR